MVVDKDFERQYAFLCVVADEGVPQLDSCLGFLRAAYPTAPVRVICDGAPSPGYRTSCQRHNAIYIEGAFLKRIECGGAWWKRFLEIGLETDRPTLIKLDPDTRFWRPFRTLPPTPIAGTFKSMGSENENIQGGCQAIGADAARRLLASPLLTSPELTQVKTYARGDADYRQISALAYLSTDKSLVWLARNLGIALGDWGEVGSNWLPPAPVNADLRFAATHPHKVTLLPQFLDAPLHVITTCKGRLDHLKETLPRWIAEPNVTVTVVDYDCPDGTSTWIERHHPQVTIVRARNVPRFNLSHARNLGARSLLKPGWIGFFDADWVCKPGWAKAVRAVLKPRSYFLSSPIEWGQFGSLVVHSTDYHAAGGYDELFRAWGWEDGDFYARLRHVGTRPASMPGAFFSSIEHAEDRRTAFYDCKDRRTSLEFYRIYVQRKIEFALSVHRLPTRSECLEILEETLSVTQMDVSFFHYGSDELESCRVDVLRERNASSWSFQEPQKIRVSGSPGPNQTSAPLASETSLLGIPETSDRVESSNTFPTFSGVSPQPGLVSSFPIPGSKVASMGPIISVVNHATTDLGVDPESLIAVAEKYLMLLASHWPGTGARLILTAEILPHTAAIVLMDDAAHEHRLGYGDLTPDGMPLAKVHVIESLTRAIPVTESFTHALAELRVDPYCNKTATAACGTVYTTEVCDPVEGDHFRIDSQRVANFVTPAWFVPDLPPQSSRFDMMGRTTKPFEIRPEGYATALDGSVVTTHHGGISQRDAMGTNDILPHRRVIRSERHRKATTHAHPQYLARRG